ncbi:hypothetical protein GCM10009558_019260 [Virgisporangium aurantiacum]
MNRRIAHTTRRRRAVVLFAVVTLVVGGGFAAAAAPGGTEPGTEPVPRPEYIDDARSFVADVDFRSSQSGTGAGAVVANVATPGTEHLRRDLVVTTEGGGAVLRSATMPSPATAYAHGVGSFDQPGRYPVLAPYDSRAEILRLATPGGATVATVDVTPAVAAYCQQHADDASCGHDAAMSLTAAPEPVPAGTTLVYTPSVRTGPGPAFGTTADLTLPLPAAAPLPDGCTGEPGRPSCALGRVHPGASKSVQLGVPVPPGFLNGRGQRATITASGAVRTVGGRDADGANNAASRTVEVIAVSDLGVTKTGSRPGATAGEVVEYTIKATNAGPSDADRMTLVDALPAAGEAAFGTATATDGGVCGRDSALNKLTCTWPAPVGVGASRTVTVRVTVTDTGQASTFTDEASVSSVSVDPVPGNNKASVTTGVIAAPTRVTATPILVRLLPGVDIYILTLTGKVERTDTGAPVVGRSVRFVADNGMNLCTATTGTDGVARCPGLTYTLAALLSLGYTVNWAGDTRYLPASGRGPIIQVGR